MRTTTTTILLTAFMMVLLTSCNDKAFVTDIGPSVKQIDLDGDGDTAVVTFKSGKWNDILFTFARPLSYRVLDNNGSIIEDTYGDTPVLHGLGSIEAYDSMINFTISRSSKNELKIEVVENSGGWSWIHAEIEYDNTGCGIMFDITPCTPYVIDHVDYNYTSYGREGYRYRPSLTVTNNSSSPTVINLYPYREEYYSLQFIPSDGNEKDLNFIDPENPPVIDVPTIVNGVPGLYGEQAEYNTFDELRFPMRLVSADHVEHVEIAPNTTCKIEYRIRLEYIIADYTISVRNPVTGRVREITGTFSSYQPFDNIITQTIIDP